MLHPADASAWQIRCPSPPLPPVTTATAPFKSMIVPIARPTRRLSRAASRHAMALLMHGLELVPVGIAHERRVIARAIVWARSRPSFIRAAGRQRGGMEAIDRCAARGVEREMKSGARRHD